MTLPLPLPRQPLVWVDLGDPPHLHAPTVHPHHLPQTLQQGHPSLGTCERCHSTDEETDSGMSPSESGRWGLSQAPLPLSSTCSFSLSPGLYAVVLPTPAALGVVCEIVPDTSPGVSLGL